MSKKKNKRIQSVADRLISYDLKRKNITVDSWSIDRKRASWVATLSGLLPLHEKDKTLLDEAEIPYRLNHHTSTAGVSYCFVRLLHSASEIRDWQYENLVAEQQKIMALQALGYNNPALELMAVTIDSKMIALTTNRR